jgi:hypothetical protein
MTFYSIISGKRALFDPGVKVGTALRSFRDGTDLTIAAVEAKEAVPGTKPEIDIAFEEETPAVCYCSTARRSPSRQLREGKSQSLSTAAQ